MIGQPIIGSHAIGQSLVTNPQHISKNLFLFITTDNDPLCGVKVPCFGDQLTRVRFAGAKDLRAGGHLPKQRLDHIYPFRIVDWHPKKSFLKVRKLLLIKYT